MKIKINMKKIIKTVILYGSFCIIAGTAIDYGLVRGLMAVQLPHKEIKCETRQVEPEKATTTPESKIEAKKEVSGEIREVSAYNSLENQTDESPCVGADGTNLCERYEKGECLVATNAYPMKTILEIENFGKCIVADRMNKRYTNRVDIFMNKELTRAINFGIQNLRVAVIN
jgi:3D (Asp-Asp-Asp) domain-containing protein